MEEALTEVVAELGEARFTVAVVAREVEAAKELVVEAHRAVPEEPIAVGPNRITFEVTMPKGKKAERQLPTFRSRYVLCQSAPVNRIGAMGPAELVQEATFVPVQRSTGCNARSVRHRLPVLLRTEDVLRCRQLNSSLPSAFIT